MHVYDTTHSKKGLRTEKVCVKGAPHLGELENVKPIRLVNFGTPSWRSKPHVCTAYDYDYYKRCRWYLSS